jgi:hypothetical protein
MPRREKRMTEPRMRTRRMEKLSLASRSSSVVPPTGSPICAESVLQGKIYNEYQVVAHQRVHADDDIFSHLYKNNDSQSHSGTGREVNLDYLQGGCTTCLRKYLRGNMSPHQTIAPISSYLF